MNFLLMAHSHISYAFQTDHFLLFQEERTARLALMFLRQSVLIVGETVLAITLHSSDLPMGVSSAISEADISETKLQNSSAGIHVFIVFSSGVLFLLSFFKRSVGLLVAVL